ncbi:hypothetical protein V9T40_002531 [Parthenolecanium corni]|uniref:Uncharacterized protein n=1 Tax=Parthenolecanium corni TaxID=536013 RepID=A0AAN9TKY4_9HEMI
MAEIVDRNNFPLLYNNEAINIDVAISGIISTLNSRDSIPPNIVNILDILMRHMEDDYRSFPESSNLDYDDDTTSSSSSGHDSSPEAKKQKLEVCLKAAKKEKFLNNVEKRLKIFIKDSPVSDFQKKCYIRSIISELEFTVSEVSTFVVKR